MSSINVIAFENGVGNSRDLALITGALGVLGHEVAVTRVSVQARRRRRSEIVGWLAPLRQRLARRRARAGPAPRFDLNLMLEHVWPEALHIATRNVVVPNPEWFDGHDQALLRWVDGAWAKTHYAHRIFDTLGCPTTLIGFASEDRHDPAVVREPAFFHLAGKSRMKGTTGLVRLWATHPEWPTLTVVHSRRAAFEVLPAGNIRYETRYLSDSNLRTLQNRHVFHLCPSETEGWGHYIPEAMSTGAVVLATDAAPMNELVGPDRGLLIAARPHGRQHLAMTHVCDSTALERTIERAIAMPRDERQRLGLAARAWFVANQRGFGARLAQGIAAVGGA